MDRTVSDEELAAVEETAAADMCPESAALDNCPVPAILIRHKALEAVSPAARSLLGGAVATLEAYLADRDSDALGTGAIAVPGEPDISEEKTVEVTLLPFGRAATRIAVLRDITLERNLRTALSESRSRYKDLVEASSDFSWETDSEGTFVLVSSRGALGYQADALVGRHPRDLVVDAPEDGPVLPFMSREPLHRYEIWFRDARGDVACLVSSCVPLIGADGGWRGARGVCRDVTAARARDAELATARHRERLMSYVLSTISDVIDPTEVLETAAAALSRALDARGCVIGWQTGEITPAASAGEVPSADLPGLDLAGEGGPIAIPGPGGDWLAAATRTGGGINGAVFLWRPTGSEPWDDSDRNFLADIAGHIAIVIEQAQQHRELQRLSNTDTLTGLDNRRAFFRAIERRLAANGAGNRRGDLKPAALIYVDLDNFKQVNDRAGHQRGDEALNAVAAILRRSIRAGDRVARLGGDEFALWLEGLNRDDAMRKATALLEATGELAPFAVDDAPPLGFSIGVAVYDPAASESLAGLVARADAAMYSVKRRGKGAFEVAAPAVEG